MSVGTCVRRPIPYKGESMTLEDEYRAEAERLKALPRAEQRYILAMLRDMAKGKGVPAKERKAGLERAAALERFLKLAPKRRKK
jgi:hypothetical protein